MPSLFEMKYNNEDKPNFAIKSLRVNDEEVTYFFKTELIDKYKDKIIKNQPRVIAVIKHYLAINSSKLGTRAPTVKIPMTDSDKSAIFKALEITPNEVQKILNEIRGVNDIELRNNVINDTFNVIMTIITAVYFLRDPKRNDPKKDFTKPYYYTALYLAIRFYSKIYISSFPKADPRPDVMDYTIENISNKFLLKKVNNIFDIIKYFSESNIMNMSLRLERMADVDIVYFSTNMYNRMHNSMKTLAREFYKNKEEQNYTKTDITKQQDETGDFFVGDTTSISSSIDILVKKIVLKFVSDTVIDDRLLTAACNKTKFSKSKFQIILQRIREANNPLLKTIISQIISYFLLTSKKDSRALRSSEFITEMIKLYQISNTKNDLVLKIKDNLAKLISANSGQILKEGNANMLDRVKNSLFVYLVLFIAKNSE